MPASPPHLVHHLAATLTMPQVRAVLRLMNLAFPIPESAVAGREQRFLEQRAVQPMDMVIVWEGEVAIATATFFPREVSTVDGTLRLMALAAVCSDPARRGAGWGRAVVRAAWAAVDDGRFPVSLFQTSVPDFYARLGARLVSNSFINTGPPDPLPGRSTRDQPWWNPHLMIYPASFPWPAGTIDLCGPGY